MAHKKAFISSHQLLFLKLMQGWDVEQIDNIFFLITYTFFTKLANLKFI